MVTLEFGCKNLLDFTDNVCTAAHGLYDLTRQKGVGIHSQSGNGNANDSSGSASLTVFIFSMLRCNLSVV